MRTTRSQAGFRIVMATTLVLATAGRVDAASESYTSDADFGEGTAIQTVVASDSVELDIQGVGTPDPTTPWWDTQWGQRRCLTVTNNEATPLTEFQIRITLDTATPIAGGRMSATGDDLRFIGADGATVLDYWIEGPIDDAATSIWFQTDVLPPGASEICLYHDNPAAPPTSDPLTPFTYAAPRPLYVAVSEYQAGRDLAVASYTAGNVVSDGTTTVTLAAGATATLPGASHTAATIVSATGPLSLRGVGSAVDAYVPLAFAGTTFVLPTTRSANRVSLYAPGADATVTIEHSGTSAVVNVPTGTVVSTNADITSDADAMVITSTQPVLVTHTASATSDAFVAVPLVDEPLYGIRSTLHLTGFGTDGSAISITESGGGTATASGDRGGQFRRTGGGSQGTGPAVLVTSTAGGPVAAIQQADSDGGESSSYWPSSELNVMYRVATSSQYVAIACPEQTIGGIDSDGTVLDCTGSGGAGYPGKALDAALAPGALVQSLDGTPFYLYAEDQASNDEANVLGPKQARLVTANPPTVALGPAQSQYQPAGAWESPVIDTVCFPLFETISWNPAAQPAGTTLEIRVASATTAAGPFDYVGPDGTAGTTYTVADGEAVAALHDGDRFVRVRADLTTADPVVTPSLDDLALSWSGTVSVTGDLFEDVDGNGVNGGGDAPLDGVSVELWRDDGDAAFDAGLDTMVANTVSVAGAYSFVQQSPGTYFVVADDAALDPAHLIGNTPNPVGPLVLGDCGAAVVDIGWEFGANVTASVFDDTDANGISASGEAGIAGVRVELWRDDGDGVLDRTSDARAQVLVADSVGGVSFATVPAGDYFVSVAPADEPVGFLSSATTDNPVGPLTLAGGDDAVAEIGFAPAVGLSGRSLDSVTAAALPGVRASLWLDDGDGAFDPAADTFVTLDLTDAAGRYAFRGLVPGAYWVEPGSPPAGYLPAAPVSVDVSVGAAAVADLLFDPAATVSGRVIADDDGITDATTIGLPGVTLRIYLDDGNGTFSAADRLLASTVSDGDGAFAFGQLPPGRFWVEADPGSGVFNTLTSLSGQNPVGPVAAGADDVLFVFDPLDLTLPATGGETRRLVSIATMLLGLGVALLAASRRRSVRRA